MIKKKIIIATGGTGGHVFPAISLANYLLKKKYDVSLTTDKRGYTYLKNHKNLNLIKISSSPLVKKNILKLIFSVILITLSVIRSLFLLLFNRPLIVFGMGGYSSFPICIAAWILGIKFVIYENNLIIGKANKYLLPFTKKIFVSYKDLEGIPNKYKSIIFEVGNIVREDIINLSVNTDKKKDSFNYLNILVLGGSQAAKVFGNTLPPIFRNLKKSKLELKIIQQCLQNQNKELLEFYKKENIDCEIFNFTDRIIDYYLKANLVITRSGASVLGEVVNMNIPFIAIPLPTSAENHQRKNAEFFAKKGYGYALEEKDINNKLLDLINLILKDKTLITNILHKQRQYSDKKVFENLIFQLEKILNEKN